MKRSPFLLLPLLAGLAGCSTLAGNTNMLTDERIRSEVAGAIGAKPEEVTLLDRRTAGTNTYVTVRNAKRQQYACIINGGNFLSFGMTNPPQCSRK